MAHRAVVALAAAVALAACSSAEESVVPTASSVATSTSTAATATTTTVAPSATSSTTSTTAPIDQSVQTLAAELSAVEAGIRVPDVSAAELDALGRRQQLAYRAVNRHPEWHADLTASVDPVAQVPLSFHLAARQAQVDHAAGKPPGDPILVLPAWTIVDPLPAEELLGYYREAEAATGVPWHYLAAINFQETRMGRIVGVSSAGAVGPMQFLPSTWAGCCEGDPTVARDAIMGAARYLVLRGAPADMQAALNGYNPNAGYVGAVTAYAMNMQAEERAYLGYHGWQVFFGTSEGTVRLPVGYSQTAEVDAAAYLRDHPADLVAS
jgi:hypothetical protein